MDLSKDILSRLLDLERRLGKMESANQVQKIANSSGEIIIDQTGLNSLSNFTKGQILSASSPTVSSGSYTSVSGSTLNSFTLSRSANVLIYFNIDGYMNDFSASSQQYLNVAFVDNSVTVLQDLFVTGNLFFDGSSFWLGQEFATQVQFVLLSAGVHQFSLQVKIDNYQSGNTALLANWTIGYIVFGG